MSEIKNFSQLDTSTHQTFAFLHPKAVFPGFPTEPLIKRPGSGASTTVTSHKSCYSCLKSAKVRPATVLLTHTTRSDQRWTDSPQNLHQSANPESLADWPTAESKKARRASTFAASFSEDIPKLPCKDEGTPGEHGRLCKTHICYLTRSPFQSSVISMLKVCLQISCSTS